MPRTLFHPFAVGEHEVDGVECERGTAEEVEQTGEITLVCDNAITVRGCQSIHTSQHI